MLMSPATTIRPSQVAVAILLRSAFFSERYIVPKEEACYVYFYREIQATDVQGRVL